MNGPAAKNRAGNLKAAKADSNGANNSGEKPCPLNHVTPHIELEHKVVLLDRKLYKHQTREPKKRHIHPDPTYILVWATQSNKGEKPWEKKGKLMLSPANVEVFLDEKCRKRLKKGLTYKQLTGGTKKKLWLRGVTAGKFKVKLTLEDPGDAKIKLKDNPAEQEMGVVELELLVHQHEPAAVAALRVNPDEEPLSTYHTNLKNKALPEQKKLSDKEKVKKGRLLHEQSGAHFGRAKLIIKKLDASQWPEGTDAYEVVLGEKNDSGSLAIFDQEFDGTKQPFPLKYKVSDLKAAEKAVWLEGGSSTTKWRGARLDLGLDRPAGGLPKKAKHNGDWSRCTVVKIKEVKLEYRPPRRRANAWDAVNNRFFINMKSDPNGRKITLGVQLTEKLRGVVVHFMLVEHKDNRKAANWGKDMPTGAPSNKWVWKDITKAVKHSDKSNRQKILHLSEKTNRKGYVKKEVILSRFGGDKFYLAACIEQDPHLAKYIDGHADLGKRKPVMRADPVQVWRKFWYKEVKVRGITVRGFGNAADTYSDVKAVMLAARRVEMKRRTANRLRPRVIYPKHMVSYYWDSANNRYVNNYPNDNGDALVVGDDNESKFFKLAKSETDKPVMIPILNAHALWIKGGNTASKNIAWQESTVFPVTLDVGKGTLDPPLAGGTLLKQGRWEAEDWTPPAVPPGSPPGTPPTPGSWGNRRNGNLAARDLDLDPGRSDPETVRIKVPAGVTVAATKTRIRIRGLVVRHCQSFLGTSYADGIVNAYTPNDEQDFINTINHELGHSFKQVAKVRPAGIPAHKLQYDKDGSHCNFAGKKCLMYESGPQPGSLNRYCSVCHPYVLVQDMSSV
ncbi:hypothetical protein DJ031_13570 [bacterium endosymbiont of Escarpia laminata]|nr:MAG: hypothetical protein DJ031_13570 [bacterium endosymbiont of Escarpia laminata]